MLYVFCGDRFIARELSREFISVCKEKRPDAEYVFLSTGHTHFLPEELLVGSGLFERKYVVFCDELLSDSFLIHLLSHPEEYHRSPHMFVLFEPDLSTADEKTLTAAGAVVRRESTPSKGTSSPSALFSFTDTFLQGNPVRSLTSLYSLLQKGESSTSLLQILVWQVRILALVACCESATEAGVKPFVYTKTKRALHRFSDPLLLFTEVERHIRFGRLRGYPDEEIITSILLHPVKG